MNLAVLKEITPGERRVALVPESTKRLVAKGIEVLVEAEAGAGAWFSDHEYRDAGARVERVRETLLGAADVVVKIHPPSPEEVELIRPGSALVSLLNPPGNAELLRLLSQRTITALALDQMPRTTVAQTMDVLSSQSTAAGYRAVILAAHTLPKFFPLLMTPAGTVRPARVLVLGAGVAGLQAIAVARRLGAVVEAFDVRRAVKEQVESLGAKFVEAGLEEDAETAGGYAREVSEESKRRASETIRQRLAEADVCITTALVAGRRAPTLITEEMVQGMQPGSVIVDLAAAQGGNCEVTEPGQTRVRHGVTVVGPINLAGELAVHASQMYSRNVERLLLHVIRDGALALDLEDEITRGCTVTHAGKVLRESGR